MSSHREAPEISKDPVADSADLYAFVSPDKPDTVTIIANYVPLQSPDGGPNFFEFGDDVLYQINISTKGDGFADISYHFHFTTHVHNPETFLYNTGQITSLTSPSFNRRQTYSVLKHTRHDNKWTKLASNLPCPPCNVGPRSTPDYPKLAKEAVHSLKGGGHVFAGQRADAFHVDLGSVFDLLDLRPFSKLHLIPGATGVGTNSLADMNVHSIALQIPIKELTGGVTPTDVTKQASTIGVWTTASRKRSGVYEVDGEARHGDFWQVSRLGNPLVNEAVIPMGKKDLWNHLSPRSDKDFLKYFQHPEVSKLLPVLYPGVFPHLAALSAARADLVAVFLTGLPGGIVPGFQNYTGPTYADMLRLNLAIKPSKKPNVLGVVGGDLAGWPNGRRPLDDVFTIELRALAGVTYPLVAPSYVPDGAASLVADGSKGTPLLKAFPYLNTPHSGFTAVA
jgi:Domain of unknown function (DUF4331)